MQEYSITEYDSQVLSFKLITKFFKLNLNADNFNPLSFNSVFDASIDDYLDMDISETLITATDIIPKLYDGENKSPVISILLVSPVASYFSTILDMYHNMYVEILEKEYTSSQKIKDIYLDFLTKEMNASVKIEDYDTAILFRDKIKNLN